MIDDYNKMQIPHEQSTTSTPISTKIEERKQKIYEKIKEVRLESLEENRGNIEAGFKNIKDIFILPEGRKYIDEIKELSKKTNILIKILQIKIAQDPHSKDIIKLNAILDEVTQLQHRIKEKEDKIVTPQVEKQPKSDIHQKIQELGKKLDQMKDTDLKTLSELRKEIDDLESFTTKDLKNFPEKELTEIWQKQFLIHQLYLSHFDKIVAILNKRDDLTQEELKTLKSDIKALSQEFQKSVDKDEIANELVNELDKMSIEVDNRLKKEKLPVQKEIIILPPKKDAISIETAEEELKKLEDELKKIKPDNLVELKKLEKKVKLIADKVIDKDKRKLLNFEKSSQEFQEKISAHSGLKTETQKITIAIQKPEVLAPSVPISTIFGSLKSIYKGLNLDQQGKQQLHDRFMRVANNPQEAKILEDELKAFAKTHEKFSKEIEHLSAFINIIVNHEKYAILSNKLDPINEHFLGSKVDITAIPKDKALNDDNIALLFTYPDLEPQDWLNLRKTLWNLDLVKDDRFQRSALEIIFFENIDFLGKQYCLSRFLSIAVPSKMGDLIIFDRETQKKYPGLSAPSIGIVKQEFKKIGANPALKENLVTKNNDKEGIIEFREQGSISLQEMLKRSVHRLKFDDLIPDRKNLPKVEERWRALLGENQIGDPDFQGILKPKALGLNIWQRFFRVDLEQSKEGEEIDLGNSNPPSESSMIKYGTHSPPQTVAIGQEPEKTAREDKQNPEQILTKVFERLSPDWIRELSEEDPLKMPDEGVQAAILIVSLVALQIELEKDKISLTLPEFKNATNTEEMCAILNAFLNEKNALQKMASPHLKTLQGLGSNVNRISHKKDQLLPLELAIKTPIYIKKLMKIPPQEQLSEKGKKEKIKIEDLDGEGGKLTNILYTKFDNEKNTFPLRDTMSYLIKEGFVHEEKQNEVWKPKIQENVNDLKNNQALSVGIDRTDKNTKEILNLIKDNPTHVTFKPGELVPIEGGMGGAYLYIKDNKKIGIVKLNAADLFGPLNTKKTFGLFVGGEKNPIFQDLKNKKTFPPIVEVEMQLFVREGIPVGESAQTEACAYEFALALGLEGATPFVTTIIAESPDFLYLSDVIKEEEEAKFIKSCEPTDRKNQQFICSIQPFATNSNTQEDFEFEARIAGLDKSIPEELIRLTLEQQFKYQNIEKIRILEMILGECDPNAGNYLIQDDPENPEMKRLIKIDNALTFSTLHADFANGAYNGFDLVPAFKIFPTYHNYPISDVGKKIIYDVSNDRENYIKILKEYNKSEEAIQAFEERMDMLVLLCDKYPDVTIKQLYTCMGSDEPEDAPALQDKIQEEENK
jgi:hypothetical protein